MPSMMSLQENTILERALDYLGTLSKEKKPILKCLGRTLAKDIVAPEALPPYDYSIVDGYALCSQMTSGVTQDNPKCFSVLGEVLFKFSINYFISSSVIKVLIWL